MSQINWGRHVLQIGLQSVLLGIQDIEPPPWDARQLGVGAEYDRTIAGSWIRDTTHRIVCKQRVDPPLDRSVHVAHVYQGESSDRRQGKGS